MSSEFINAILYKKNTESDNATLSPGFRFDTPGMNLITRDLNRLLRDIESFRSNPPDAILIQPDADAVGLLDMIAKVRSALPGTPVLLYREDENHEPSLVEIDSFLLTGRPSSDSLTGAIRYAIERKHWISDLLAMSLTDELTGLYNRRGFLTLARQQLKLNQRSDTGALLLFADLDRLKRINDHYGHHSGDRALKHIAGILRNSFRTSDIIARWGGDEFTIFAPDAHPNSTRGMLDRIQKNIREFNRRRKEKFPLSLSVGAAYIDSRNRRSLDAIIQEADRDLYSAKRRRIPSSHIRASSVSGF